MDFSDATPDTIFISEGNSTRRPTEKELFELFGFWKCKSGDCDQELASLGLTLRVQEPLVIPEQVITVSSPPPAEATLKPASGAGSLKGSLPVSVVGSGTTQSAEATPTVMTGPVPTGRFMRPSHVGKHRVKSYHN
jgi:hypothetical protein